MLSKSFRPVTLATVKTTTRISRCCMGTYKSSTGLPGVDVDPNGRENLIKLSEKVLESVKVSFSFKGFTKILKDLSFNFVEDS